LFASDAVFEIAAPFHKRLQISGIKKAELFRYKFGRKDHDKQLHISVKESPAVGFHIIKDDNITLIHGVLLSVDKVFSAPFLYTGDLKITVPVPGIRMAVF